MQDPEPSPPTTWVPHRKVVIGALSGSSFGGSVAVLTLPFILPHYPAGIDHDSLTVAWTDVCVTLIAFIGAYFTSSPSNP